MNEGTTITPASLIHDDDQSHLSNGEDEREKGMKAAEELCDIIVKAISAHFPPQQQVDQALLMAKAIAEHLPPQQALSRSPLGVTGTEIMSGLEVRDTAQSSKEQRAANVSKHTLSTP